MEDFLAAGLSSLDDEIRMSVLETSKDITQTPKGADGLVGSGFWHGVISEGECRIFRRVK